MLVLAMPQLHPAASLSLVDAAYEGNGVSLLAAPVRLVAGSRRSLNDVLLCHLRHLATQVWAPLAATPATRAWPADRRRFRLLRTPATLRPVRSASSWGVSA